MIYLYFCVCIILSFKNLEGHILCRDQIHALGNFAIRSFSHEVQEKVATCVALEQVAIFYLEFL